MPDLNNLPENDSENDQYPIEPRYHPVNRFARKIFDSLASSKLAMFLLVFILACCVVGVTVYRGQKAGEMIFGTLWFNGMLILLVINVACCFFGRIWGRKVTIISFGMILFHLSFVAIFAGIVYNSLFHFDGVIRLTEGETLPSGDVNSYDRADHGRFFSYAKLRGETTLIRMHIGYKVEGEDKRAAYEVEVGERGSKKKGIIYITHNLDYGDIKYLPEKEGYSLLTVLSDAQGREIYGAFVPLQSLKQGKENSYLYATGTKEGPESFPFPQEPEKPRYAVLLEYTPSPLKERSGEVHYQVWPLVPGEGMPAEKKIADAKAAVTEKIPAGAHQLSVKEVGYWVAMNVRYDPGKPVVLVSLWAGLGGMIITTFGRMLRRRGSARSNPGSTSLPEKEILG